MSAFCIAGALRTASSSEEMELYSCDRKIDVFFQIETVTGAKTVLEAMSR